MLNLIIRAIGLKTCSITTLNIKSRSFVFKGYRLITSSGYCKHSNGELLSRCYKSVYSLSECEAACTSSNSCVGYFYGFNYCYLLPSSQSYSTCQTGYTYNGGSWFTMAETSDDLVAYYHSSYQCYAKNEGINNLYLSN